jgi:hypothetical protein
MDYREYRNPRNQLHRAGGPAIEAPDRIEWWVEGRRHHDKGPAVETKHGTKWYYWRGVRVPEHVIMDPRATSPKDIIKEPNAEVRRAWMEAFGLEEFMTGLESKILDRNDKKDLMLVSVEIPDDEPLVMVRVKNSTPEGLWKGDEFVPELKDGKPYFKHYFLRVPPTTKTAEEAVAWTFDMKTKEYAPVLET